MAAKQWQRGAGQQAACAGWGAARQAAPPPRLQPHTQQALVKTPSHQAVRPSASGCAVQPVTLLASHWPCRHVPQRGPCVAQQLAAVSAASWAARGREGGRRAQVGARDTQGSAVEAARLGGGWPAARRTGGASSAAHPAACRNSQRTRSHIGTALWRWPSGTRPRPGRSAGGTPGPAAGRRAEGGTWGRAAGTRQPPPLRAAHFFLQPRNRTQRASQGAGRRTWATNWRLRSQASGPTRAHDAAAMAAALVASGSP